MPGSKPAPLFRKPIIPSSVSSRTSGAPSLSKSPRLALIVWTALRSLFAVRVPAVLSNQRVKALLLFAATTSGKPSPPKKSATAKSRKPMVASITTAASKVMPPRPR